MSSDVLRQGISTAQRMFGIDAVAVTWGITWQEFRHHFAPDARTARVSEIFKLYRLDALAMPLY